MTAAPAEQTGSFFDQRYEVLGELGSGSFGEVFKARQASTGQIVAVKVLRPAKDGSAGGAQGRIQRFRRETKLCAELLHPNIVPLIDSGEMTDGRLYAVFQFVPGMTLRALLAAEGKLRMSEAVHLMGQVLDAVSCAHAHGVVHRDLKPENVMVTQTGVRRNALVLDFGISGFASEAERQGLPRLTATDDILGTPGYAAPEQLRGEPPSGRSDLYSWGLMFLECLTGERPFQGASVHEVILKQLGPQPAAIPQWLRNHPLGRVLEVATAKQAEKRDVPIERLLDALGAGEFLDTPGAAVEARAAARERRQVTVVCCRFTVSAAEGKQPDVEEITQLLQARQSALAERAAHAGGTIAAVFADRIVLTFGYPQAHEDDARRAARLALEVVREAHVTSQGLRAEVRIGIHTGLVVFGDAGSAVTPRRLPLTGLTPQIASQLADRAGAGEVLVSADHRRLLREEFSCETAGECAVSELSHPLAMLRLTGLRTDTSGTGSRAWARETPLVGRSSQLQQLLDGWEKVRAGRSGVVIITGEAGLGKSRLLHELRQRAGSEAWIEGDCAPENQNTPLQPVIDALLATNQTIESLLGRFGLDIAENLPLFAALLSIPLDERFAPLHLSAERQKELTLRAIVSLLFKMAEAAPLVLAVDNLHWADPTTLELGALLIHELRSAGYAEAEAAPRLFLVCTTRPDFVPQWSGENVAFLPLDRLGRADVELMVKACFGGGPGLSPTLVEQVSKRAEGVPLFVEEVTRVVRESAGTGDSTFDSTRVEIPTSVRDLLTARLDGISTAARDTAELAAVIGREFDYELLEAVSSKDPAFLREDIAELGRAGLVFRRRSGRGEIYVFRHVLLRDAAYESLTRPTRQSLHGRVAHSLRDRFPEIERHRPEILAPHFENADEKGLAVDYWLRAASASSAQAAYVEASSQIQHALEVVRGLPSVAENRRREMDLLALLGVILMATRGWAVPETEEAFVRAWQLADTLGTDPPAAVLWGIFGVETTRSDRAKVRALQPRWEEFAKRSDNPALAYFGESALGIAAYWAGDLPTAQRHLESALAYYGAEDQNLVPEGGLYAYVVEAPTLWALGYADRARAVAVQALAIAERRKDPYWIAAALGWGASVSHGYGDWDLARQWAQRLMALADEQRLFAWWAPAACECGLSLLSERRFDESIDLIRKGLDRYRSLGVMCSYNGYLPYLAAAYLFAGRLTEAAETIEEGIALCQTLLARVHEPELLRLRARVLRKHGDSAEAESCYRSAIAMAEHDGSLAYALRAATELGRFLAAAHRSPEALEILGRIYERFTEGFTTHDLLQADALLRTLRETSPNGQEERLP